MDSEFDLPDWVWDLVDAVTDYENPRDPMNVIPLEVIEVAAIARRRAAAASRRAADAAWSEGWHAMAAEHRRQRDDPSYPIGRDVTNPYAEEPPF